MGLSNAAADHFIHLQDSGNAVAEVPGDLTATVGGDATVDVAGTATAKATKVVVDAPESEVTGNLTVVGTVTAQSGIAVTGTLSSGKAAEMAGNMDMGSGDIEFDSLLPYRSHVHSQGADSDGNSEVDVDAPQ